MQTLVPSELVTSLEELMARAHLQFQKRESILSELGNIANFML